MDREQAFLETLAELTGLASQKQNIVTMEDIRDAFGDEMPEGEQLEAVRTYLREKGIGIDEAVPFEEKISEDEKAYLDLYLEDLDSVVPLSRGERTAAVISSMAGDRDAQGRLAEDMLKDVVDVARLYAGQDVYMEDLIGAGNEALMIAVSLLAPFDDPEEAEGFIIRKVMDAMEDQVSANLDIRADENEALGLVSRVSDEAAKLAALIGRKVSAAELERETDLTADEIERAVRLCGGQIGDIQ